MSTFDRTLLDEAAPRGARIIALSLLSELDAERARLSSTHDLEALHDFRVALRRLRSWLRALRPTLRGSLPRGAVRRLRRLAKASNAGRDAEVFLDWLHSAEEHVTPRKRGAVQWLIARFERQQREADTTLEELLTRDFARAHERMQDRLESYQVVAHIHGGVQEASLAAFLATMVREHAEELSARLTLVQRLEHEREAHRARIAGKRLRYLLEPVAPFLVGGEALVERLKALQDSLGDLHDAHIWLMMLREMAAEAAMEEGRRLARTLANGGDGRGNNGRSDQRPSLGGFAILAHLAQVRATEALGRFRKEWGKRTAKRFFRDLETACAALDARARQGIEIERKYLLSRLPKAMPAATTTRIMQGYLPGSTLVERLRSERRDGRGGRPRFYRTVKAGRGIVRTELEEETSRGVFETMWPLTDGKRVTKLRHYVPDGDRTWEIDEFPELGLVMAELEVPSATTVVEFPSWLAPYVDREVTGEPEYLNVNLAR
jgi:CHAD domain-containing protein/CYTH domain-containing protein